MWIFTIYGFFSIAVSGDAAYIRARDRLHLENLCKRFKGLLPKKTTVEGPEAGTDYEFRMAVPKADWVAMAAAMAEEVNSMKFKPSVSKAHLTSKSYIALLYRLWETIFNYGEHVNGPNKRYRHGSPALLY